ncbi:MAG: HD-GYP domain-containing protein [Clostridiaceae bacterium]
MNKSVNNKKYTIIVNLSAFLVGMILWILDAYVLTHFVNEHRNSFWDNLIFDVKINNLLMRMIILLLLVVIAIISCSLNSRRNNEKIQLENNYDKINNILKLTSSISKAKDIDEKVFMSDLLNTAIEIIPEADYGMAYIYEEGFAIPVSAIGHDKNALINLKYKEFIKIEETEDILIIKNFKDVVLSNVEPDIRNMLKSNTKEVKETMFIILSLNGKKIASISLGISKDSAEKFSKESIEIARSLKNIPAAFFTLIKDYESKQDLYKEMILSIIQMLSLHNPYTKEHSTNVAQMAQKIAEELKMSKIEIDNVYWTGLVHDIGKILVSDDILDKKGRLTYEEYEIVKKHPVWGYETLTTNKDLSQIAKNVLHHHERWDGKGYPDGISGENIPFTSRIIAVADTYDAMTSDRPYRKGLSKQIAINEIVNNSGTQFDPEIVKVFVEQVCEF